MKENIQMTLGELAFEHRTDKDTTHSYVGHVYEDLFKDLRDSTNKILEIGIDKGYSMLMWRDYFQNAEIFGIDINDCEKVKNQERINPLFVDAYSRETLKSLPNDFDILIDDGPHTLKSMIFFIINYEKKLKENGYMIIEDVADIRWFDIIKMSAPKNLELQLHDLRMHRPTYDNILIVAKKTSSK